MPTPWKWWVAQAGENWGYTGECDTREAAIAEGRLLWPDEDLQILEGQMSTAQKYEGSDSVPFIKTRNHEIVPRVTLRPVA